jgi:cytochrome c-type biogenesis protein CcmH/NrfG
VQALDRPDRGGAASRREGDRQPQHLAYDGRSFGEWAHASLGLTHLRAGRNAAAVTAYAQAQRCAPDNPEYTVKRALAQARVDAACRVL